MTTPAVVHRLEAGTLRIEIHPTSDLACQAAADAAAEGMQQLAATNDEFAVIFATGASQLKTLEALTSMTGLPWNRIAGFHLDEYIGIPAAHPASFRGYLRQHLQSKVDLKRFEEINGMASDPHEVCRQYASGLQHAAPKLCLLGVGENGHLAFNDPGEANFDDPMDVRIVHLDDACRRQQAAEGWFSSLEEVPQRAITVTIPALFRVPQLILSVPGPRKAEAVKHLVEGPISTDCPASILRRHPNATLYLDYDSASQLAIQGA